MEALSALSPALSWSTTTRRYVVPKPRLDVLVIVEVRLGAVQHRPEDAIADRAVAGEVQPGEATQQRLEPAGLTAGKAQIGCCHRERICRDESGRIAVGRRTP